MKRVISWVVLYLICVLTSLLTSVVVGFGGYLFELLGELNAFLEIIIYIVGGFTFLSFLITPAYYGAFLAVIASEAIKCSKKGTRYYVLAIYSLISNVVYIILGLANGTLPVSTIIMCLFYIFLIVLGKNAVLENASYDE